MSFTFEQMMSGTGLPEENVRQSVSMVLRAPGVFEPVPRPMQETVRTQAFCRFKEVYGKTPDTIVAAEKDGEFVCVAYRVCP